MVIRVLLMDEQSIVRTGLKVLLERGKDCRIVGEAGDCPSAVELARITTPDVVLLDVEMSTGDGIAATAEIAGPLRAPPRVLVLTNVDVPDCVFDCLRAGASGFMLKRSPGERIMDAVRTVHRGGMPLDPCVTPGVVDSYLRLVPSPYDDARGVQRTLSDREGEIVNLVARGLSTTEIATALHLSSTTVKTHVSHILAKWGLRDRVQLVARAYETGFLNQGRSNG